MQGLDRLNRKLAAIPKQAEARAREALEQSAEEIVGMMRNLVPKGETRQAVGSIGWTWGDAPAGTVAIASGEAGGLKITIYAGGGEAFYARFLEFGTVKMAAQPFFYVSYRANRKRAKSRISRAIKKGIREAVGG